MSKRQPVTSATAAVAVAAKSQRTITAPAHVPLEASDLPFWRSVIAEFARSEWTDHQLEMAALLARTMADLEAEQLLLRKEGAVIKSAKGAPMINPRRAVMQMHIGTIMGFRRSLSMHGRAQGEPRDVAKRRGIIKDIEAGADQSDGLLPRIRAVK